MNIIYIDAMERYRFFSRLEDCKEQCIFVTHLLSVYYRSLVNGIKCYLVASKKSSSNVLFRLEDCRVEDCLEFYVNSNREQLDIAYSSTLLTMDKIFQENDDVKYGFVWNGQRLFQKAFSEFLKKRGVKVRYIEITNLPGKLQVDDKGVNAQSSFMEHASLKDCNQLAEWSNWKRIFVENYKNKSVGQVKLLKKFNFWYGLDIVGYVFFKSPNLDSTSLFEKVKNKLQYKHLAIENGVYDSEYIFFPLQVSSDSQIIMNYHGDLFDSIEEAMVLSRRNNLSLVLKIHPAETNLNIIHKVIDYVQRNENVYLSSESTFDLIDKSNEVITVNSTVGIESILLGKKVTFLGKSVYKNLPETKLAYLIMNVYKDIDYFSDDRISFCDLI